jgi:hypothetical protein
MQARAAARLVALALLCAGAGNAHAGGVAGDVYALVDYPFATVGAALKASPAGACLEMKRRATRQELRQSSDTMGEEPIMLHTVLERTARDLIARQP